METPLTGNIRPDREPPDLPEYERAGGYRALRKALLSMTPWKVVEEVRSSMLRGRGGAGFPTGMKWTFVPKGPDAPRPKYLVCNADEMEPGTFKDRLLMEGDPHQLIEGMIVSAYAIEADVAWLFLRVEYALSAGRLAKAIAEAYGKGYLGKDILGSGYSLELYLHTSAGRYMCGEESGLLNSLEGKRATPRAKPPFPAVCGLWGKPTVINNVETLCNVPHIVNRGADWFKGLSRTGDSGTKLYGVSGRVRRPGISELPMGTTIREILESAGGMQEGYRLRAVIPGGASTEFVPAEHQDMPMDFDSLQAVGSRMGTGTMIVLDDRTCPVAMLRNLEQFFARESCGWCTPCRDGLPWVEKLLDAVEVGRGEPEDLELLAMHAKFLGPGLTFCALAPGAMEPLRSGLSLFRDDFLRHIREKRCPWR
ncbi:MAG: NADH-quinone oxidoreductase subunit NuoF [Deltaproteobacteria bacterium]|nr:NADH-quinone oxidoreductase subunit NuoF [Deltaproteobacteria bacterium]